MTNSKMLKKAAGDTAENKVHQMILGLEGWNSIRNLIIPHIDPVVRYGSAEVDELAFGINKLFPVEVKGYKRVLAAPLDGESWTGEYHRDPNGPDRRRNGLCNPIHQNQIHREAVIDLLDGVVNPDDIIAISTVFTDDEDIVYHGQKVIKINNNEYLVHPDSLVEFMIEMDAKPGGYDYEAACDLIYDLPDLKPWQHRLYTKAQKALDKLVKKKKVRLDTVKMTEKTCPVCGSRMRLMSKYDLFWTCDNTYCTKIEKFRYENFKK